MQFFDTDGESLYLCFGELKIFWASWREYRYRNLNSLKQNLEFFFFVATSKNKEWLYKTALYKAK